MPTQADGRSPNPCRFHRGSVLICRRCVTVRLADFRSANFRAALERASERISALARSYRSRGTIQVSPEVIAAELDGLVVQLDEVEIQASKWRGGSINDACPPGTGHGGP